ncbi:MAG: linear amide C-N hydrolase [Clostridia bacterium]|nr:linear amide C-N hydrolase [Clostridia bacterium]
MKTKKRFGIVKKLFLVLLVIILAVVGAVYATWHHEIATALSFRKIIDRNDDHQDGSVYRMDVSGGFYFEEFLAEGGAKSDSELIGFITGKLTKGLIDMGMSAPEIGCSSFTATAEDGDRLFGRNYDFSKTNTAIVYTNPGNGRHASYSTVDLQFLGMDENSDVTELMDIITCLAAPYAPLDGINDAGVACGIYMTYQGGDAVTATHQNTDKPDLTSTTMLRLILDYADSAQEAVELIQQYDFHDSANTSFHYMVADSTGRSAILEWVPAEGVTDANDTDGAARTLNVIWNDVDPLSGATDWQYITNFIITPGYYAAGDWQPGLDRYEHLGKRLAEINGHLADDEAAMSLLAEVGRRTWNNDDGNGCTVHSAVYNLTDKTMLWVANEHYGEESHTIRLSFE